MDWNTVPTSPSRTEPTPDISDRELLDGVQSPADFAPLYERYVEPVYRYCYRRVSDPELAADLTSAIFTKAIEALPRFSSQSGSTFRSWLFTIAHNQVIDSYRRQRPQHVLPPDLPDQSLGPEDRALQRDELSRLLGVLHELPTPQRQIIDLRLAGLTAAEIADTLGVSRAAVKSAQTRAYRRLRDLLTAPASTPGGSQ